MKLNKLQVVLSDQTSLDYKTKQVKVSNSKRAIILQQLIRQHKVIQFIPWGLILPRNRLDLMVSQMVYRPLNHHSKRIADQ